MSEHTTETIWVDMDVHLASIAAAILQGESPQSEIIRLLGDRGKPIA